MSNNRTEQQAAISALSATVDLAELKAALEQAGYVFKKDVAATISGTSGALVADFTINDTLVSTITGDATYSFVGLENGQRAKLIINKGANDSASFVGIGGTNDGRRIGTTQLLYDVLNINGDIILTQINYQFGGSLAAGDFDVSPTPDASLLSIEDCAFAINNNINNFRGKLRIQLSGSPLGSRSEFQIEIPNSRVLGDFTGRNHSGGCCLDTGSVLKAPVGGVIIDTGSGYQMNFRSADAISTVSNFYLYFNFAICIK